MKPRLLVIPAIIAACSAAVIWASLQLELSPPMIVGKGMQPRAFPIFLMVINLLLVAILAVQLQREGPKRISRQPFTTWGTVALLGIFYALTVTLDMFIGIAVVMFLMCRLWGERRIHVAATLALVAPLSIFILFDSVLKVRFPRGILMDWYYG
ncbi:MAG: tripartite tricarboxylate transporter TctB family protein [Gammaproteobacteria bacterium]|nr:tripartite tricarboxylate transporter TctB family protein [Gammaproteobacteria bacterium]